MSLRGNIDHLAAANGIEAVFVHREGERCESEGAYRGADRWEPVLRHALGLLRLTDESTIRLVAGDRTIVVQREANETAAVALPTGHPVAKSLRRMIRRMAKKDRGPLNEPKARPTRELTIPPPPTAPRPGGLFGF